VEWGYTRGGFCEGRSLSTVESVLVGESAGIVGFWCWGLDWWTQPWEVCGEKFLEAPPKVGVSGGATSAGRRRERRIELRRWLIDNRLFEI
jgi:hypothetical protein